MKYKTHNFHKPDVIDTYLKRENLQLCLKIPLILKLIKKLCVQKNI